MTVRALIVSHTATVGGAERSLLRFLDALPGAIEPAVACPDGPLALALAARGVPRLALGGTAGSLRLHPLHTPKAVAEMATMAVQVQRYAERFEADLVHANTLRAGLVAVGAHALGAPPVALHVRDVLPPGGASAATRDLLLRGATTVVAISRHVARKFTGRAGDAPGVHVVMELVDPEQFRPAPQAAARAALDLPPGVPVLAVLAQLTPWKGQDVAIRAFADIRRIRPDAVLLLVGGVTFAGRATRIDNGAYERSLHALAIDLGVADAVRFLGPRHDVPEVLAAIDVLLAPSHEEPFGLGVIEAMAMERAVVATSVGGPAEVISDGIDGRLVDPRDVSAWSTAALGLLADPSDRAAMGAAARRRVLAAFTPARYGDAMARAYRATATTTHQPAAPAAELAAAIHA
jgi:glycosyltransferase involved in cell wall biosynthesis